MPPVFARIVPDPHPYDDALTGLSVSPNDGDRAVGFNLKHDHRVSPERERALDAFVARPSTAKELQRGIVDYFHVKVRERIRPDYVYAAVNGNNLLTGIAASRIQPTPQIHKDVELVRLLDLNGLGEVFRWAKLRGVKPFASFTRPYNQIDIVAWLDWHLHGRPKSRVVAFVRAVLDELINYRLAKPYQPAWATTYDAFASHEPHGPDRWLEALGMYRDTFPRWLLLLKYTVREAGTVVRPTQLDAGWFAHHFPSPPQVPLSLGGHCMDLRTSPRASSLLPEYIHKQIDHNLSHWINIGRTSAASSASLVNQRQSHHELLATVYGSGVYAWMRTSL